MFQGLRVLDSLNCPNWSTRYKILNLKLVNPHLEADRQSRTLTGLGQEYLPAVLWVLLE